MGVQHPLLFFVSPTQSGQFRWMRRYNRSAHPRTPCPAFKWLLVCNIVPSADEPVRVIGSFLLREHGPCATVRSHSATRSRRRLLPWYGSLRRDPWEKTREKVGGPLNIFSRRDRDNDISGRGMQVLRKAVLVRSVIIFINHATNSLTLTATMIMCVIAPSLSCL